MAEILPLLSKMFGQLAKCQALGEVMVIVSSQKFSI